MFYSSHAIMLSTTYFMRQGQAQTWLMKHWFDEMTWQLESNIEYKVNDKPGREVKHVKNKYSS